jgi:hypothetical protein
MPEHDTGKNTRHFTIERILGTHLLEMHWYGRGRQRNDCLASRWLEFDSWDGLPILKVIHFCAVASGANLIMKTNLTVHFH